MTESKGRDELRRQVSSEREEGEVSESEDESDSGFTSSEVSESEDESDSGFFTSSEDCEIEDETEGDASNSEYPLPLPQGLCGGGGSKNR